MSISNEQLRKTAKLAHLDILDAANLSEDIQQMVNMVEKLSELDISEEILNIFGTNSFPLREDINKPSMTHDELFFNTKNEISGCFTVNKVME